MKKLFKKKTASRSNEWMENELLSEKKIQKKQPKMWRKKKYNPIFNKKSETLPKIEWMAHELFFEKKCIKNKILDFEWMNEP